MQSVDHRQPILTDSDFDDIVTYAQELYYKKIIDETPIGLEGEA